jgi:outer membrane protein assembly factor BamD
VKLNKIPVFLHPVRKFAFILVLLPLLFACKNEFEKIRASGNADLIYDKGFELYEKGDYVKAQALFEQILSSYRGKEKAEKLYFTYAYTHYHLSTFETAAFYFSNFASTYSTSTLREEADFMAAYSHYKMSPTFRLDQTNTLKAIDEFQAFANLYPKSKRVDDANRYIDELRQKLEKKAISEADLYFDLKQYASAIQSYENMLKEFPESNNTERVRFQILKASFLLAENSIYEKQEERYKSVVEKYTIFKNKYNRGSLVKEAAEYYQISKQKLKQFTNERYQN